MNAHPPSPNLAAIVTPAAVAPPRHVILVPGIWDTAGTLRKMANALHKAGMQATVVPLTPNNGRASLDVLARQLDAAIRHEVPAGARFSIVGFSMGGLVGRAYLRQFGDPRRVATFISISSPHRGTWMAWLASGPGVRDMRPGSAFLAAIDADAARYRATRWMTIRTPLDLIILPSDSSSLAWARNESVLVAAHPLMVLDGRVIRRVVSELASPPPD